MYKIDVEHHLDVISSYFDDDEDKIKINQLFRNLVFKLEKNLYHHNNIDKFVSTTKDSGDFSEMLPIYFELESIFVSMRSTVDMCLHLINFSLDLKIPEKEVYINNVYFADIPKYVKDVFNKYTRKRNNPTWEFIYTFRNEIVHENSIFEILKLDVRDIEGKNFIFADVKGSERDIVSMISRCLRFLDTFLTSMCVSLGVHYKLQEKKN